MFCDGLLLLALVAGPLSLEARAQTTPGGDPTGTTTPLDEPCDGTPGAGSEICYYGTCVADDTGIGCFTGQDANNNAICCCSLDSKDAGECESCGCGTPGLPQTAGGSMATIGLIGLVLGTWMRSRGQATPWT